MWDASQYLKFAEERWRPFADLLGQVHREDARFIVDLGCGTGHLTRTVAERWPSARVVGIDNSSAMLDQARPLAIPGRLTFVHATIEDWAPDEAIDLLVSNAALHWVGNHDELLSRLVGMLAPDGTLAVQMPHRFDTPAQAAIEATATDPRWASALKGLGLHRDSVHSLAWYVERLHDLGLVVNAWETTYVHVLKGDDPVLEWMKGTALRPLLDVLSPDAKLEFLHALSRRLRVAYPARGTVTLFPFPRLFFVAARAGNNRSG